MTHDHVSAAEIDLAATMASFEASKLAHETLSAIALGKNKEVLFTALRVAGITEVIVTFDGAGDSGQIEDIEVRCGDAVVVMPEIEITLSHVCWGIDQIEIRSMSLQDAVETLVYDLLSDSHGGWENCDGASGEFRFDAGVRTILLDYNERFTSSEHYSHSF